jgi:antitoxin (DNA-binding transcriptional repressor) of toxin-antitoxin stability system
MREIGAFEAKNRFGQLLDWAERGEQITITRHGRSASRSRKTWLQPGRSPRHLAPHPRARRADEARRL